MIIKKQEHTTELIPLFDTRKSFYKKALVKQIQIEGVRDKKTIYLLYSYNTIVAAITSGDYKTIYLNEHIQKELLFSNTTLRHIKEFAKQFYKNETITKQELLKKAILKNFDFIEMQEDNNGANIEIADYKNYYLTTNEDTRKFFKSFKGYREQQKADANGKYLLTKSVYGYANYYFLNI